MTRRSKRIARTDEVRNFRMNSEPIDLDSDLEVVDVDADPKELKSDTLLPETIPDIGNDNDEKENLDSLSMHETSKSRKQKHKKKKSKQKQKNVELSAKEASILSSVMKIAKKSPSTETKAKETLVQEESSPKPDVSGTEEGRDDAAHNGSDEEISIIQVVEVPSEQKFLRKRASKETHPSNKKHKSVEEEATNDTSTENALSEEEATSHTDTENELSEEESYGNTKISPQIDVNELSFESKKLPSVIEVESSSEDEMVEPPTSQPVSSTPKSSIRLLYNSSYKLTDELTDTDVNVDTVTVHDLVGAPDLLETFQFNFNVDLEYFLTFLHPNFAKNKRKIVFVTGTAYLAGHPLREIIKAKYNISECIAPLPNRFASHHSKMMINFYPHDQVEIIIMTCNLTQLDFGGLTQSVWRSGKLKRGKTTAKLGSRFKQDLERYLLKYKMATIEKVVQRLRDYNYNSVGVELVASAPGTYSIDHIDENDETYGYGKLRQVLQRNDLLIKDTEKHHNILAQVTSIAYPYSSRKGDTASILSHLLCPLMFSHWKKHLEPGTQSTSKHQEEFKYKPQLVFPTVKEVASSNFGFLSGSAVHFKHSGSLIHQKQYEQNVKPYLCKWSTPENVTGRERVTPHVKYYACDNGDGWNTLKWVLVGSHNLSKQAWGYPEAKSKGQTFDVASYELSVLVPGSGKNLVPVFKKDVSSDTITIPVRFPFKLPPTRYGENDLPWSAGSDYGKLKDRWGNLHNGGYSV
ncbi:putative tyrosyl-DNA phosphodiesterase [Clavispora lusitaniae]|uniref:Tyrosyl-DNA phosphodiesterase n=2 Tax=Clavispora lusitaniae TaxID=36911 RepID=C4Y428_CLAL4|nr:uncharacterized protein CLUG_02400 [Clavispora lusitaniae ATCC 42720]KAF5211469.1 hypothetical protein E0198_002781 [Clavispora lusitaniae]EEQ38274.1 hypothetical protein CLUG_02400 [Clavispora lusitaniae ATCC 42720]QFZ27891.1 putative tyrosyl-DNA phosphodiesterase [Clavispora lusitaniae]QFZ32802.1 putative tyrosyl-DNA phosphodiesterase [Clavispora lusitaniae]QFZ38472.1 putative tyrosyl-DNA phosphodiesterase [Clavispora lusitaniae]